MKPTIALISLCFILGSCSGPPRRPHTADSRENRNESTETPDPYSVAVKVYGEEIESLTGEYFSKYPDLDKEHTVKLQLFIKTQCPNAEFIQRVKAEHIAIRNRAAKSGAHRDTPEFPKTPPEIPDTASSVAYGIICGLRGMYVAKYVDKDPIQMELFGIAVEGQRECVSWVSREVTIDEFCKNSADNHPQYRDVAESERLKQRHEYMSQSTLADDDIYRIFLDDYECEVLEGDRFFAFSAPMPKPVLGRLCMSMWRGCGFLHVRDKKIIEVIYTIMQ